MGSLRHWYKRAPFWEGVASTFDLFGVTGISITDLEEIVSEKRRYEAIKESYDLARKDLESHFKKYEREFKESKEIFG